MSYSPPKLYFFRFIKLGTVVLFLLNCSGLTLFAQNPAVLQTDAAEIEKEARSLGKTWAESSIRQSSELFLKAAAQWEDQKQFQKSAACLRDAVKMKLILAEEVSALGLLKKSLALEQKIRNPEGQATTLAYLTIVSLNLGDNKNAKTYLDQALSLANRLKNPAVSGRVLFASGSYFYTERNFSAMIEQHGKALEFFREAADKGGEAEVYIELAYGYIINNDRLRGRDSAQKALEIAGEIGDMRLRVFALIVLGDSYQRMGEWQAGLKAFAEAESLFPENLNFFEKAILYNRLAFYNLAYNELNQAKKYFQKSFELFDRIGNSEGRSELLTELGQISVQEDNFDEAMRYFNQSRKIAVQSNDPLTLSVLNLKIGETFYNRGDFSAAEKSFSDSLFYYNKIGIDYRIAEVEEKLGLIAEKQKNYSKAREKYLFALNLNKKVLSKFAQAQNLYNLARLGNLENQNSSALKQIQESIELTESSQGETANNQLKRKFIANVFDRYELYINLLMKMNKELPNENYAIEALQAAEKSRARVMLENLSLSETNFTKDADAETVRREKEIRVLLNAKADELTDLLSQNAAKNETDKISGEINELDNELETIKARLKQQSPIYSAIKNPAPFDVGEFQRNVLDENSLLLEFSLGKDESYLWLIGKNEVSSYVLPPREEIESKIEKLRGLLKANELKSDESVEDFQKRIREAEIEYQSVAKDLSNQLFGQIADKLAKNRLIIVPDGELHYFPIAALPQPNSATDEPILLTNETIYEPSAQTLTIFAKSQKQSAPTAKNLLVFSDPIFTSDDARFSPENKPLENANTDTAQTDRFRFVESLSNLPRLAASKDESETIINIVGAARADNFSGFAATREKLLNLKTADYKIIHFATHGLTNEERPELSGIVLSRFDEKGQKLNEFFRIQDIYGLNLNADLVVLSACETGIGKAVKGEGLMSLNNAFLQTGAKTVMSSLWKVEDSATLELMKNFYGAMKDKNLTPSESLRQAQIKLRENSRYKSPFYWAAFTVQGDFRNVPKISNDSGFWVYLLPIVPLALIGFYVHRRRKIYSTAKP